MKIGLFKTVKNAKLKLTPPIPITLQVEEERGHVVLKIRGCHSFAIARNKVIGPFLMV